MKERKNSKLFLALVAVLATILIPIFTVAVYDDIITDKYNVESHCNSLYDKLTEISSTVIKEGNGIDLSNIPYYDNLEKYSISYNQSEKTTILKFSLNDNNYLKPYITVTLSEDYNIISVESNCSSLKRYTQLALYTSLYISIMYFLTITVILSIVLYPALKQFEVN